MEQLDFLNIINSRRSVRSFTGGAVDKDLISKLIEAATKAPSACNIQGWHFIVIDKDEIKQKLIDYGASIVIKNAPIGILVLYDSRTKNTEYQDHIQSAAAAIENILLTATYYNLGVCWICHLPPKRQLRKIFSIPNYYDPIAYILLGHRKNEPVAVPRKYKIQNLISYNEFKPDPEHCRESNILLKKILIKLYHLTPLFLKRKFLNKYLDENFVKKFEN